MIRYTRAILCIIVMLFVTSIVSGQTVQVALKGNPQNIISGKPIHWGGGLVAILEQDGRLTTFHPSKAEKFRKASPYFKSFSQSKLRGELFREFGKGFDVSGTGQFLVVHPAGQRDRWAQRFEDLYRSMQHYFRTRGFTWNNPEFPFIAVVFPTQQGYLNYARKTGSSAGSSTLGYYDPETNRIHMYDVTANRPDQADWYINAETIIHEAAHQTAFNVGIHSRYSSAPRWIVEGLGTLFESKGVWDASNYRQLSDRVNVAQLKYYRRSIPEEKTLEMLKLQVGSDDVFRRMPSLAYAHAWALTFYLTEKHPREYAQVIKLVNQQKPFQEYGPAQRLADFKSVFGKDLTFVNTRMQRFLKSL